MSASLSFSDRISRWFGKQPEEGMDALPVRVHGREFARTGAAPGKAAVMTMVGKSKSGKFCTFIWLKDSKPAKVSNTNNTTAGTGLRIDQAETFMAWQ